MLQYIKYLVLAYLSLYVLIHWLSRGKVSIGFISWLHFIHVKINLSKFNISIRSIDIQIRPIYYLHRKKLQATHHDGLIVIHIYKLQIDTSKSNNIITDSESVDNINSTSSPKSSKSSKSSESFSTNSNDANIQSQAAEKLLKTLKYARWILPITVVLHDFSITNKKSSLHLETMSLSLNCDVQTNSINKTRDLKNSIHINLSNLHDNHEKLIKDLKWTFIAQNSLEKLCPAHFSKIVSTCVGHGINLDITKFKKSMNELLPPKTETKSKNQDKIHKSTFNDNTVESCSKDKIKQIIENFDQFELYFAFDEAEFKIDNVKSHFKNTVFSLHSIDKNDEHINHENNNLYKVTLNVSGLNISSDIFKSSRYQIEFFNFVGIWDIPLIVHSLEHMNNTEVMKTLLNDDHFIARNFITITNSSGFTHIDDILLFKKMKREKKLNKKLDVVTNGNQIDKKPETSLIIVETEIIENLLRLSRKVRVRLQSLTTVFQVSLNDNTCCHLLIDDILVDSSLTGNVTSLFEESSQSISAKSLFSAVRNVQFSIIDGFEHHRMLVLDLLELSGSGLLNGDCVVIEDVKSTIHHIEFLAENIDLFKKLSIIFQDIIDKHHLQTQAEIDQKVEIIDQTIDTEIMNSNEEQLPGDASYITRIIHNVKFTIHKITLTACFTNPVKYWDGEDQTPLNAYKRGVCIVFKQLIYVHDNTVDIPISNIKLLDFNISLIRDYDNEKQKRDFTNIFNLSKFNSKYTYLNHRLSCVMPVIDITLSVEVLWTLFFVETIFKALKGKYPVTINKETKHKKKPSRPLNILAILGLLMIKFKLPSSVDIALELDSLRYAKLPSANRNQHLRFKAIRIYGQNPQIDDFWTLVVIISKANVKILPKEEVGKDDTRFLVDTDDIRIEIPYQYVFYKTFDNLKAFFKSIKKLRLNFRDIMFIEEDEKDFKVDVIKPSIVNSPPRLPKIKIRSKRILYCNHDDPFEEELTRIILLSEVEQHMRLAKLADFSKYEKNILKLLKEKYSNSLKFDGDTAIMPESINHKSSDFISNGTSAEMKKSFSTGYKLPASKMNRQANNTISSNIPSRLSKLASPDECDAWLNYQREYHTAIEIPRNKLYANISKSWIRRVKTSEESKNNDKSIHGYNKADPRIRKEFLKKFPVVMEGNLQPLFCFKVLDAVLDLNEPEFGLENYTEYLHRVGGGMPKDMRYGILFPLNLKLSCSELRVQIKDFPLPLIGFGGNKDDGPQTVMVDGDLVICEQAYTEEEIRYNFVSCVPQYSDPRKKDNLYAFHIGRTMTNVKFITDMTFNIDSSREARVSWAPSLQCGISYAFNSFDLLSKPPLDISPKIGFWDKMPLLVPSKFTFHFKKGISLFIKSSQSPYHLIGRNAGFAFKWDSNATLSINKTGKPEDFLIVESEVFEIGVPVFDPLSVANMLTNGVASANDYQIAKVLLRLDSKPVIWKLGCAFERNVNGDLKANMGEVERTNKFRPHYDVSLRNPDTFFSEEEKAGWDSYEGWRSSYIYLALSVYSRDDNKCANLPHAPPGTSCNSLHLTPQAMLYFFFWWSSFKTSLGLPIKEGKMFKNEFLSDKKSPKFGSSIFGLSYSVDLSPLYLSHVYQHSSAGRGISRIAFTGLKCFVKSFTMDLHQTRKEVLVYDKKTDSTNKESHLKMDKGVIDFIDADLRILSAIFNQASAAGMLVQKLGLDRASTTSFSESDSSSSFSEESMDRNWYDHNDFIELETQAIPKEEPKWKALDFASSPRFYYVRETPSAELDYPFDTIESTTHRCELDKRNFAAAPASLVEGRIAEITDIIDFHNAEIKDFESKPPNEFINKTLSNLRNELQELHHRLHILRCLKDKFGEGIFPEYDEFIGDDAESGDEINYELSKNLTRVSSRNSSFISKAKSKISSAPIHTSNYRNRFSIYTINIKWTKNTKMGVLRYLETIKDRKFVVFSMSQQASNLAEQLRKSIEHSDDTPDLSFLKSDPIIEFEKSKLMLDDFDQELHNTSNYKNAETDDSYLIKLILPQIAVTTNNKTCTLLTSNQIVLRNLDVKGHSDNYNNESDGLQLSLPMESRSGLILTDAFVYVMDRENILTNKLRLFSPKSVCWPPKLPIEMYYTPGSLDECVVIQDLSCALLYVKPNSLHFSEDEDNIPSLSKETIRVIAPDFSVMINSEQYETLYEIANSFFENEETEIQKMKKAVKDYVKYSDLSNFDDLYEDLVELQRQARSLSECRRLMVNANISEGLNIDDDILDANIELEKVFLSLNAIVDILQTSKNKKYNDSHKFSQWNIMASTIKLVIYDENNLPFTEVNAIDSYYMFTQSQNGESVNTAYVYDFAIFDKHPKAIHETVVVRLHDSDQPLFRGDWTLAPPVGGIRVVTDKELTFAPLKVEFDMRFADKLEKILYPKSQILSGAESYDTDDSDAFFENIYSIQSNSSINSRRNSFSSELSATSSHSTEKSPSKVSKVLQKFMHKKQSRLLPPSQNSTSTRTPLSSKSSISSIGDKSTQLSGLANSKSTKPLNCTTSKVKIMEERSSKYYLANHILINSIDIRLTFNGTGKYSFVNLTDFHLVIPKIDVSNRLMSNEEFFALVKSKLIFYVLRNTHNLIKSTLKVGKSSKGASSNPSINPIMKFKNRSKSSSGDSNPHITEVHSHSHQKNPRNFHDSDLLGPQVSLKSYLKVPRQNTLTEIIKNGEHLNAVDDTSIFQSLENVVEEDEASE
ncbi:hypothetical protein DAPK24_015500 [Pichia kluyveri]|uniref:FMP27 GFWDK domain-containing protein n=1 Tax=Pichia kluyveri TaxID=36015 RepID=A0AAV5R161_PICKL|nr:hypothetical protein DAPK24_015500 [Pichia kluyveri]